HDGVPPAAVDVDEAVGLVGVGDHHAGFADSVRLAGFDGVELGLNVLKIRVHGRACYRGGKSASSGHRVSRSLGQLTNGDEDLFQFTGPHERAEILTVELHSAVGRSNGNQQRPIDLGET